MNWNRYKILIIAGAVTVLACGGLVFWLVASASAQEELSKEMKVLQNKQNRLTNQNPYPSKANLEALLGEQIKVRERHQKLLAELREGQLDVRQISRSRFGDYVKNVVPELREKAKNSTKGGENGVILRDPDFGLTPYLEGTLPGQNEVNRLVVEIDTLKHLTGLLFESGISELVSISAVNETEEEVVAPTAFATNARAGRRRETRGRRGAQEEEAKEPELSFEEERERMFEAVTFEMEFKIYEDFFWETLNAFLADENQIVISSLAITNSNTLLWPDYLQTVGEGTQRQTRLRRRPTTPDNNILSLLQNNAEREDGPAPAASETVLPGLSERRQFRVGGDLLDVVLELKVYRMKPDTGASDGEGV